MLNSSFYRHGSPLYLENDFPQNFDVYAYMSGQKWTWVGFPNQDQHVLTCGFCQTVCTQTVSEVAARLLATAQLNFQGQGQHSTLPVEHLPDSAAEHGFSREQILPVNSNSFTSKTITTSGKPKEDTGIRYLIKKFDNIHKVVLAESLLLTWSRKTPLSDIRTRLEAWLRIVSQSQQLFEPRNIAQLLPVTFTFREVSVIGSRNRLNKYSLVKYHDLPIGVLPIVSNKDEHLLKRLLTLAHIDKSASGPTEAHLSQTLTLQRLRTHLRLALKVAPAGNLPLLARIKLLRRRHLLRHVAQDLPRHDHVVALGDRHHARAFIRVAR